MGLAFAGVCVVKTGLYFVFSQVECPGQKTDRSWLFPEVRVRRLKMWQHISSNRRRL